MWQEYYEEKMQILFVHTVQRACSELLHSKWQKKQHAFRRKDKIVFAKIYAQKNQKQNVDKTETTQY